MRVSVRQVMRHRRRYIGVVLAIALGVAGFLNIVTMSREVKKNFNENLDLIGGVTVIRIYFDNQRSYRPQWFREQTLAALKSLDGVKELSLTAVKYSQTNFQGQHFGFTAIAVDEGFLAGPQFLASHRKTVRSGCRDRAQTRGRFRGRTGQEDFRQHPESEAETWKSTRKFIGFPGCWGELPTAAWPTPSSCPSPPPRTGSRADCWPTVSICAARPGMMSAPSRLPFPGSLNPTNPPKNFTSKSPGKP